MIPFSIINGKAHFSLRTVWSHEGLQLVLRGNLHLHKFKNGRNGLQMRVNMLNITNVLNVQGEATMVSLICILQEHD